MILYLGFKIHQVIQGFRKARHQFTVFCVGIVEQLELFFFCQLLYASVISTIVLRRVPCGGIFFFDLNFHALVRCCHLIKMAVKVIALCLVPLLRHHSLLIVLKDTLCTHRGQRSGRLNALLCPHGVRQLVF